MPDRVSTSALAATASASRKRSHAQITRSESRSSSESDLRPKRRRTRYSPIPTQRSGPSSPSESAYSPRTTATSTFEMTSASPSPQPNDIGRFVGDGFDFRRPTATATTQTLPETIDLTGEDDGDEPPTQDTAPRLFTTRHPTPHPIDQARVRPPLSGRHPLQPIEIVSLSDDDDDTPVTRAIRASHGSLHRRASLSSTPEIVFVSERAAPPLPPLPRNQAPTPQAGNPGAAAGLRAVMTDVFRRGGQLVLGMPPFQNLMGRPPHAVGPNAEEEALLEAVDTLEAVNFDYRQAAFAMGDRDTATPAATQEPYKEPPKPQGGFAANVKEEEVYACPLCGDELNTGDTEVKQQVWVVKQCGHVYCGECNQNRILKGGTKKQIKEANQHKRDFKTCAVDGCGRSVGGKGAMIQVYL